MIGKLAAIALTVSLTLSAHAQTYASNDGYRVCAPDATEQGIDAAAMRCGTVKAPDFTGVSIDSTLQLKSMEAEREAFRTDVAVYGQCITQLINSYRRPGAPADSNVPDQAACAHSWAQDQATKVVRDFGKACIDYSNRSVMDSNLDAYTGACYPSAGSGQG